MTYGQLPVYYDGSWVINAIRFCNTTNDIVNTCVLINNTMVRYDTDEFFDKMASYAESLKISPTALDYEYVRGKVGFKIAHSDGDKEIIDDYIRKCIDHFGLKPDKMGVLFQVIKILAISMIDCTIDEIKRQQCETLQQ